MKLFWILATIILLSVVSAIPAAAQTYFIWEGSCQEPGQPVVTQGTPSTTPVQITHVPCQVNVFLHGTSTRATLFSDDSGTPLANPFNSQTNGYIHWEVTVAGSYDITLANTVTGTPTFPQWTAPFTISGQQLGAAGGGGGGGAPGGSTNDIQINAGGGTFGGTSGHLTYNPGTQTMTFNGSGGLNITGGFVDFSVAPHTIPNFVGPTATITGLTCGNGWTAISSDGAAGQNYYTCGTDNAFHLIVGQLPSIPGTLGQLLISNGLGALNVATGLFHDSAANITHFPGGIRSDSTIPFSAGGICPSSTPLGVSAVGQALIGWDVGCVPKISFNALGPYAVGLQSLIDYTYQKDDANGCWALTALTGDAGICRIATGVTGIMNPSATTTPAKVNIYSTYTSPTVGEFVSVGWSPTFMAYYVGSDHGSLGGVSHPLYLGANGITTPFWGIQTVGPLTCLATNPSCDFGSVTNAQQIRNMWQAGFLSQSIIGPTYPVNAGGVQVGLVASPTATSPVQALTSTTAQTTGNLGIVAYVSNGTIPSLTIVNGGAGYTGPLCSVTPPPLNSGVTATCSATQLAGVINTVTITNVGANNGYQSIQSTTVTITDANGSGAVVIPVITATTGFAGIAQNGSTFSPIFDGAVSIRNRVVVSIINGGQLHDSGIPCSSDVPTTIKSYGCSTFTDATGAGRSVPMQVNMIEALETMLLGVTPSATTCPTAAPAGSTCKDTITISPAQPDTNYFAQCYVASITTGFPVNLATLTTDKAAGSFKVMIVNGTAAAAQAGTYDCALRHK